MGEFSLDAGVTHLFFFKGHPAILNDHRESGMCVSGMSNLERDTVANPGHAGGIKSIGLPGNTLGSPRMSWKKFPVKRTYGCIYSSCSHHDTVPDKWWKMDAYN